MRDDEARNEPPIIGFSKELKFRIQNYFKDNHLSKRNIGWKLHFKPFFWLSIYLGALAIPFLGTLSFGWSCVLFVAAGLAMTGIGLNTMHGENHGSYSKKTRINKLAGARLCLFGGNPFFWKLQQNILHHMYTNVHSKHEDISAGALRRFSRIDKKDGSINFSNTILLSFIVG